MAAAYEPGPLERYHLSGTYHRYSGCLSGAQLSGRLRHPGREKYVPVYAPGSPQTIPNNNNIVEFVLG